MISRTRSVLKRLTPEPLIRLYHSMQTADERRRLRLHLERSFQYDHARFQAHSAAVRPVWSKANLAAALTMDYHRLEKGMTLKEPRLGYGSAWISSRFIPNLYRYVDLCGAPDDLARIATNVLVAYRDYHARHDHPLPQLFAEIADLEKRVNCEDNVCGGVIVTRRDEISGRDAASFESLVRRRHSIRNYLPVPVDPEVVTQAVRLAQTTPSVCNRQAWHVYAIDSQEAIKRALAAQNGNSGFGHQLQMLLVVTTDLTRFLTVGERNQGWIDGGMFCMTLVLALHAAGLGTCCLNLSLDHVQDAKLRAAVPIPGHESAVMMIALGHVPDELSVAQSTRRPLDDVLTWIKEVR